MTNSTVLVAVQALEEAIVAFEDSRRPIAEALRKLFRASTLLKNRKIQNWCRLQFGDEACVEPLRSLGKALLSTSERPSEVDHAITLATAELKKAGLHDALFVSAEALGHKVNQQGGGWQSIEFIEQTVSDLQRKKVGNDGTHYMKPLLSHLAYVRRLGHRIATELFAKNNAAGVPDGILADVRERVDDRLLEVSPDLAERLMSAFRRASSESSEEWSQALTTCRRLLEGLADQPP